MCDDLDLSVTLLADLYDVTQIVHSVVDFDLVMEEFFEGRDIEDFIGGGLRSIDDELFQSR